MQRALASCLIVFWAALAGPASAAQRLALTGPVALYGAGDAEVAGWHEALRGIAREGTVYALCAESSGACPVPAVRSWQAMLERIARWSPLAQLRAVNRFANRSPYRADLATFGRSDHWATPLEFLTRSGDCEDYAILKYVSLKQLGFTVGQLQVVVLKDVLRHLTHAVLAVTVAGRTYLLDNLNDAVLPQARAAGYLPLYSVGEIEAAPVLEPQPGGNFPTIASVGNPSN